MAAPVMNNERITKSERKLRKKLTKAQNTLFKHEGIIVSPTPTKILCVNNAGLVVGVSKEEVENIFSCHGTVAETIMLPQKPYAFVCYENENEATKACSVLNGTEIEPSADRMSPVTMYISYVSEVPPCLSPSDELPPGLVLLENFISQDEENQILKTFDWEEVSDSAQQRELKHRQVKHYGFEFKYGINDVDAEDPLPQGIPSECDELIRRAVHTGHVHYYSDQLTVNKYTPGQGIPPHVDTPAAFEDGIMSLSLGSQVLMDFRHPMGKHLSVLLPPRSLLIMTGESRYVWSHGITPRKSDIIPTPTGPTLKSRGTRISLTFRKIIHPKERIKRRVPFVDDQETTMETSSCDENMFYICGKTLPVISNMKHHLASHEENRQNRSIECEMCGKGFQCHAYLRSHISKVHNKSSQMCQYCGQQFKSTNSLGNHVRSKHKDNKNVCTNCFKTFKDGYSLRRHMISHDSSFTTCPNCGKSVKHMEMHKNHCPNKRNRTFLCDICQKAFITKGYLSKHFQNKHTNKRQIHSCSCGKMFKYKNSLTRHAKLCNN